MTNQLNKGLFGMDGTKVYEGYSDGTTWNGWQCPSFTFEVASQMATDMAVEGIMDIIYSKVNDKFVVLFEDDDDTEVISPTVHIIDGKEVKLYGIGNMSWCWESYNEDEKQQRADELVINAMKDLKCSVSALADLLLENDKVNNAVCYELQDFYPFTVDLHEAASKIELLTEAVTRYTEGESIEEIMEDI